MTRSNLARGLLLLDAVAPADALIRSTVPLLPMRHRVRWVQAELAARRARFTDAALFARMAIALEPRREDAWLTLAAAIEASAGPTAAIPFYHQCVGIVGPAATTARSRLAAFGERDSGSALDLVRVRATFDDGAPTFDSLLYERLAYRGPAVLEEALGNRLATRSRDLDILDVGCGTGGCGHVFARHARHLHGIDLSPSMIACARRTERYHRLSEGEMIEIMRAEPDHSYDLVLAADVLTYVHDPAPLLRETGRLLRGGGFFVGAQEHWPGPEPTRFLATGRFAHAAAAVEATAREAGLVAEHSRPFTLRLEEGRPVPGFVVVLRAAARPDGGNAPCAPFVASPRGSG